MKYSILSHGTIKILPKNNLRHNILRLHSAACNDEYHAIFPIIHMACHGGPILEALDVVELDPRILYISSHLHRLD
jgi:hypothetical protein